VRLVQSLLWQLVKKRGFISDNLRKHHTKQRSLTDEELWVVILDEFDTKSIALKAYFVVDGLDELDSRVMRGLVTSFIKLPANCRLLLTSRDLPVIGKLFTSPYTRLEVKPPQQDLKAFIQTQCHGPGSQIKEVITDTVETNLGIYEEIEETVLRKAGNMLVTPMRKATNNPNLKQISSRKATTGYHLTATDSCRDQG
jgi:hypothetical protein